MGYYLMLLDIGNYKALFILLYMFLPPILLDSRTGNDTRPYRSLYNHLLQFN